MPAIWALRFQMASDFLNSCPSTVSHTVPSGESPNYRWIPSWESTVEEVFRDSENGSAACLAERPTQETRAQQYLDSVLFPIDNLEHLPWSPFLAFLDFLAFFLLRVSLLLGGVLFFPKILGVTLPEKQGVSQNEKSKEIQKSKEGGSG